ncbi:MAG TPA: GTPase HflX [Cytophagales bacterium]|nr:GTPase HflX [Cytophagales bacterium]
MGDYISTEKVKEKAVLVGLINSKQSPVKAQEYLDELQFLAETLGIQTEKQFTQRLEKPDVRSFIGKGKLEEIQNYAEAAEIDTIIFDDDLSPSQLRNIERELKKKIYDRSLLILDIFLQRAKTAQAKTQVELARFQYLLPRLTRMWTHLERQRGGTGTRGGAGEKEIETDKRVIREQITLLKEKLKKIDKQSITQRKSRDTMVRVSLVGYTNVGKSTIMRTLSKADVFAENKLFATVDSTVRKVVLNRIPFLLTDTVGFIRKLPTTLIESFKSTLDEIREADILIHVVDISHPSFEEHIEIVNQTLNEIKAGNKPTLLVFNKIDLLEKKLNEDGEVVEDRIGALKASFLNKKDQAVVFISAQQKDNIEELKQKLYEFVKEKHLTIFPNFLADEIYLGKEGE